MAINLENVKGKIGIRADRLEGGNLVLSKKLHLHYFEPVLIWEYLIRDKFGFMTGTTTALRSHICSSKS